MPFLGQDWRSPGWTWMKTEDGWKKYELCGDDPEGNGNINLQLLNLNEQEPYTPDNCAPSANKTDKEQFNNAAKSQYFYRDKWIYIQKGSTKERHGYCTLGEAFNRLDFSSAIQDIRRFNYVVRLLQLIAKSQLTCLSGVAQKNYFNILEKIVKKVLEDQYNPRLLRELLHDLSSAICILMERFVLIGNINLWICRLENILSWKEQLTSLDMNPQLGNSLNFCDLPLHMHNDIFHRFSDAWDIVNLGQLSRTLHILSEDRHLWKALCKYHYSEKLFCKHLIVTEKGLVDWKAIFFRLQKHYPQREQYGDTLHFCRHCSILFWKDSGHPCTANDPISCLTPVSPQHFIDLFQF